MIRASTDASRADDQSVLSPDVIQDLLFHCVQARDLEASVCELVRSGVLRDSLRGFHIDPRSVVMAEAMRIRSDGLGDACFPGPMAPGPALVFGGTPLEFLRHLSVRATVPAAARAGGMTWSDDRRGLLGWGGGPGTMTQVLAGAALSFKNRGEDRVALVMEETCAVSTGAWHEGINLAGALKVPLIAVLAPPSRSPRLKPSPRMDALGASYGIAVQRVAREPIDTLFDMCRAARRRAVRGRGPTLFQLDSAGPAGVPPLHDDYLESLRVHAGAASLAVSAVERAAAASVEHAVGRLSREPGPDASGALVEVWTNATVARPWMRSDDPTPNRPPWATARANEIGEINAP